MLEDKKANLQSLTEREREILDYIMAEKDIKILEIANRMHLGESTTRNSLSDIFKKLGVPERESDKRGYIVREYSEAYRDLYLKIGETQIPPEGSTPQLESPKPAPSETPKQSDSGPKVAAVPPGRHIRPIWIIVGILGGFLCISVAVIVVLLNMIRDLNQERDDPAVAAAPTQPIIQVIASSTPEPLIPTEEPTATLPPTSTNTPEPTNTPTITLTPTPLPLFFDDFDDGLDPRWEVLSGSPTIANGALTSADDMYLKLSDPSFTNFRITFDFDGCDCWISGSNNMVGVRGDTPNNMVAFVWADCENEWAVISSGKRNTVPNTYNNDHTYGINRFTIEANGNTFLAYVADSFNKSIVLPNQNLPSGHIFLKLGRESQIDNFKILQLP